MFYFRPASERGISRFSWLKTHHSFSFGHYYNPDHLGFSALKVINDDKVAPGAGFEQHGHRNMEIISYILEGAIEHKDTLGNHFVVPAGDVQRMTAGTGIMHSEFNHSTSEPLRFLQIWITPNEQNLPPGYEQKSIDQTSPLTPIVTPSGREGSLSIHQDASIYRLQLEADEYWHLASIERPTYLHVIDGSAGSSEYELEKGDGLGLCNESLMIKAKGQGLVALWFDLN